MDATPFLGPHNLWIMAELFVLQPVAHHEHRRRTRLRIIWRDPAPELRLHAMKLKGVPSYPTPVELLGSSSGIEDIYRDIAHHVLEHMVLFSEIHEFRCGEASTAKFTRLGYVVDKKLGQPVGIAVGVWFNKDGVEGAEHYDG